MAIPKIDLSQVLTAEEFTELGLTDRLDLQMELINAVILRDGDTVYRGTGEWFFQDTAFMSWYSIELYADYWKSNGCSPTRKQIVDQMFGDTTKVDKSIVDRIEAAVKELM